MAGRTAGKISKKKKTEISQSSPTCAGCGHSNDRNSLAVVLGTRNDRNSLGPETLQVGEGAAERGQGRAMTGLMAVGSDVITIVSTFLTLGVPINKACQFCNKAACDKCATDEKEENRFFKCRCGLVGPGGNHECDHLNGGSLWLDWTNWCCGCQEWHCYSCSEIGCCDSDCYDSDSNEHLQASYRNCGGREVVKAVKASYWNYYSSS